MAQLQFVCNIASDTDGLGTLISPYSWGQFLASLSAVDNVNDNIYLLSGTKTLIANTTIKIIQNSVVIDSYDSVYPWRMQCPSNSLVFSTSSSSVTFRSGFIEGTTVSFNNPTYDKGLVLDNIWLHAKSGYLQFNFYDNIQIINSTIAATSATGYFGNQDGGLFYVSVTNSIVDIRDVQKSMYGSMQFSLDNVCLTSAVSDYSVYGYATLSTTALQENWPRAEIMVSAVSAISASNIYYQTADFSTVSAVSGNTDYTRSWFGGVRDGIGALYYPAIWCSLSADGTSAASTAYAYTPVIFDFNELFATFDVTSAALYFGDGATSGYNWGIDSSATHTYTNVGSVSPYVWIRSDNEWYDAYSNYLSIEVLGSSSTSAEFIILDSTSAVTSAIGTHDTFYLSAGILSGGLFKYQWNFGDGVSRYYSEATEISAIPIETYSHKLADKYNISLLLNAINSISADLVVSASAKTYYVNITSGYDVDTGNGGSEVDPYNWLEFRGRTSANGTGELSDTYKLKGYRNLIITTADSMPWTAISFDKDKNFTIDGWDLSANGPWIISVEDTGISNNVNLSFGGVTIKNGIVYNKPYGAGETRYGGNVYVTKIYDAFIVNQGVGSKVYLDPYHADVSVVTCGTYDKEISATVANCYVVGSTVYAENGFRDNFISGTGGVSAYDAYIVDSVIKNFKDETSAISAANTMIYNNAFTNTSGTMSAFDIVGNEDNQFEWVSPDDWPFTYNNVCYGQDESWVLSNRRKLFPMNFISAVPNPGYGYPSYPGYETGIFGYLRRLYRR